MAGADAARRRAAPGALVLLLLLASGWCPGAGFASAAKEGPADGGPDYIRGSYMIIYETGVTGIAAATDTVRSLAARQLAADPALTAAVADANAASVAVGVNLAATAAQPFRTVFASTIERTKDGQLIPGANAVVDIHPCLLIAGLEARVVAAIKAAPGVRAVVQRTRARLDSTTSCGPANLYQCHPNSHTPCCVDGTCTSGAACSSSTCAPNWGHCDSVTPIPRVRLLDYNINGLNDRPNQYAVDAVAVDTIDVAKPGVIDRAHLPDNVWEYQGGAAAASPYKIMIANTGCGPHDALRITGCRNFHPDWPDATRGDPAACLDYDNEKFRSHGTHVAGIAAAKNGGFNCFGVAPGIGIFAAAMYSSKKQGDFSGRPQHD